MGTQDGVAADAAAAEMIARELKEFASDLRKLRIANGAPSYREISERTKRAGRRYVAAATVHEMLRGRHVPGIDALVEVVRAVGGDPQCLEQWRTRWQHLKHVEETAKETEQEARRQAKDLAGELVDTAERQADVLREAGAQDAAQLRAEAQRAAEELLRHAQEEADELRMQARADADRLRTEAGAKLAGDEPTHPAVFPLKRLSRRTVVVPLARRLSAKPVLRPLLAVAGVGLAVLLAADTLNGAAPCRSTHGRAAAPLVSGSPWVQPPRYVEQVAFTRPRAGAPQMCLPGVQVWCPRGSATPTEPTTTASGAGGVEFPWVEPSSANASSEPSATVSADPSPTPASSPTTKLQPTATSTAPADACGDSGVASSPKQSATTSRDPSDRG